MEKVPYANAMGSLMYLMVCTRTNIGYGVSLVGRYLANPGKAHWEAVKSLRYLKRTATVGLTFGEVSVGKGRVLGFVDADNAKVMDRGRSITGYAFKVLGSVVSWKTTLQHVVALSNTESEYIALTEAVKEAPWLKGFVTELNVALEDTVVLCDNQGVVQVSKNGVFHELMKHINVKHHFIRDIVNAREVVVQSVNTEDNATDMLTKALPLAKFSKCLDLLGVG